MVRKKKKAPQEQHKSGEWDSDLAKVCVGVRSSFMRGDRRPLCLSWQHTSEQGTHDDNALAEKKTFGSTRLVYEIHFGGNPL